MIQQISIRPVLPSDFEQIFDLLKQLWPNLTLDFDKTQSVFGRNLRADYKRLVCAEVDFQIIGFCSLTIKDNLWQQGFLGNIDELVVDELFRSMGVGKKLLDHMIDIARNIGCKKVELESSLHRERAHKFYGDLGFETRGYLFSKLI